jgi:hypothetical protein
MANIINRVIPLLVAMVAAASMILAGVMIPVQAAPAYQMTEFPTPTPGADGRILYMVQDGDTLWRISAVSGASLDELRQLNNLDPDAVIRPGQVLLLGVVSAQVPTPEPGSTVDPASLPTPTATLLADSGEICVLLYLDENGDAARQEPEIALADGEVSVTERLGAYSNKGTTTFFDEPVCFPGLPPGEYIVTIALPGGFNRTTELSVTVSLFPGDTSFINFGAQPSSVFEPLTDPIQPGDGPSTNTLIGVIGVTLLLAGAGIGVWAAFSNRRRFTADE